MNISRKNEIYFTLRIVHTIIQFEFMLKEGVTWQEAWDDEADAKFEFH